MNRFAVLLTLLLAMQDTCLSQPSWKKLHIEYAGEVTGFVKDSIYLFASGDGLYRTSDNGDSWEILSQDPGMGLIRTRDGSLLTSVNYQMVRSSDHGGSWQTSGGLGLFSPISCMAENPLTGTLVAGTAPDPKISTGTSYRSTDGGYSWNVTTDFFSTPQGWVTLFRKMAATPDGVLYAVADVNGLFRSTDDGLTWNDLLNEVQNHEVTCLYLDSTKEVSIGTRDGTVLVTSDRGDTWQSLGTIQVPVWALVKTGDGSLLAGSDQMGIMRNTPGDTIWTESDSGLTNRHLYAVTSVDNQDLLAGTWGNGTFRSSDGGTTWQQKNAGMREVKVLSISTDRAGRLYAGPSTGHPVYTSSDRGEHWEVWSERLKQYSDAAIMQDNMALSPLLFVSSQVVVVGYGANIVRSSDGGSTWAGSPGGVSSFQAASIAFDSAHGRLVAAMMQIGVYQSSDSGITWQSMNQGLQFVTAQSVAASRAGVIFMGGGLGMFRFSETKQTWEGISGGPYWFSARGVMVDSSQLVYCLSYGYGAFRSSDQGETWINLDSTLVQGRINSWLIDSRDVIYAQTARGAIVRSTSHGDTWEEVFGDSTSNGIALQTIDAGGYLYGTNGQGELFRTNDPVTGVAERALGRNIPRSYMLSQNYPNPFNPSTMISYQIPRTGFVSLKIYNLLGQEIATLVNEEKQPGEYHVRWDGSGVPSGVYFYTLQSGGYRETRKLVMVK